MSEFAIPDDAVAALDSAMEQDGLIEGGQPSVPAPPADGFDPANQGISQGETETPSAATPTPEPAQVAPGEGEAAVEDSFTERFDPNSLPPELVPAYRLMQADYTRKRQADAERLRLLDQYQDIDLGAAVQLFQGIQNPDGLIQFVQEASDYLAKQGLVEFDEDASEPSTPAGQDNLSQALDSLAGSDPELAPLAQAVKAMQTELAEFRQEQNQRLAAEREEYAFLQALGETQRQENIIRTDNPHYTDDDIDAIYRVAAHFDGDLLKAHEAYEADFARRLGGFLRSKESAPNPAVPSGLPSPAPVTELSYDPLDPKQAHMAALEALRLIESQPD